MGSWGAVPLGPSAYIPSLFGLVYEPTLFGSVILILVRVGRLYGGKRAGATRCGPSPSRTSNVDSQVLPTRTASLARQALRHCWAT